MYQDETVKAIQTPVIEVAGMKLEKSLAELSSIIDALEVRLGPVMGNVPKQQSNDVIIAGFETQSPLGSLISRSAVEAERLAGRISSIVHRLEI